MAKTKKNILTLFLIVVSLSYHGALGFMDMEELKSVYYGLDILSEPVVITQDTPAGSVQVISKFGQQYQCTFPDHSFDEKRKEAEEKIAVETGIVEMLKPMALNNCLFKSKDWWSYEFCYGKYIRQFHMEDGDIKGNIIYLGYFRDDFDWNNETARDDRIRGKSALNRYHSQFYTLGTKCDITDEMRRAEVRFMCEENSEDYLARVDESETCVYTVTVMTSRVCRHPYLKAPARRKAVPILCNPLLSEDQYQDYMQEKQEKEKKKEEALKYKVNDTPNKNGFEHELSKALESEMSTSAKELLIKHFSQRLAGGGDTSALMSKEEFQNKFGKDETLWQAYLKGAELSSRQQDQRQDKPGNTELREKDVGSERKEEEAASDDDDDEILSEFDDEISAIREKFQASQNKLSSIRKKITLDRPWESEIENAIREAEEELGVKVDRSLVSGLSNTLDKLVNKIHDTERELSSMDKEIGKLKPGKKILINKDGDKPGPAGDDVRSSGGKEEEDEDEKEGINDDDGDDVEDKEEEHVAVTDSANPTTASQKQDNNLQSKILAPPTESAEPKEISQEHENDGQGKILAPPTESTDTATGPQEHENDIHDKILAPPKLGDDVQGTEPAQSVRTSESEVETKKASFPDESPEQAKLETSDGKPEIEVTVKTLEDDNVDLPKDLQKLLEDSVRRELQKRREQSDTSQALSFDSDHSFNRDKSVHIFQQEDEDGKTNRFIFVFGFNTFNDESVEQEKQSLLEENYSFVYKKKQQK